VLLTASLEADCKHRTVAGCLENHLENCDLEKTWSCLESPWNRRPSVEAGNVRVGVCACVCAGGLSRVWFSLALSLPSDPGPSIGLLLLTHLLSSLLLLGGLVRLDSGDHCETREEQSWARVPHSTFCRFGTRRDADVEQDAELDRGRLEAMTGLSDIYIPHWQNPSEITPALCL